jgi:hypothetical protein
VLGADRGDDCDEEEQEDKTTEALRDASSGAHPQPTKEARPEG